MEHSRTPGRIPSNQIHDLKNILAVIKLYAQLGLRSDGVPEELQEGLRIILDQAGKADEFAMQYRVLLNNIPGMAYRCHNAPGWPMEFVSEGCLPLTGYLPSELAGPGSIDYEELIRPDDRPAVAAGVRKGVAEGVPFVLEYRIITKDGEERWVWERGQHVVRPEFDEPRLEGFIMDITGRKEAQEKLLSIFRVAPAGIGMVRDRILLEVNQRICDMTGYALEELIGRSALMLYPTRQDFDYVGKEKYEQIRDKGTGVVETVWKKKDGSIIHILLASTPLVPGNNSLGVIFTAMDITDRKTAEAEQKRLQEQLTQAQKMETIGTLAGGIAHEFNNNLQIIHTFTELSMRKLEQDHPVLAYLQQILMAARQSSTMVGQLLAFASRQAVSPEVLNINHLVEEMQMMLQKLVGDRITLVWKPGEGLWPVFIDPSQLRQAVINLAINARDAIAGGGEILIQTTNETCSDTCTIDHERHTPGDFIMLSVTDDGCGMDKKTLEKIFEPFFTTKSRFKGTGLGLSTVYGIVKQNKGFIVVNSKPAKGSTFKMYFPKHEADSQAAR